MKQENSLSDNTMRDVRTDRSFSSSGNQLRKGGILEVSKLTSQALVDSLVTSTGSVSLRLPDGTLQIVEQSKISEIREGLKALSSSSLRYVAQHLKDPDVFKAYREEFIKDATLRALGAVVSQGSTSATCGIEAQAQVKIRNNRALFLSELIQLGEQGFFVEKRSGRTIKAQEAFLNSDSSSLAGSTGGGRLNAGRLWELSNLEADNGKSFNVVCGKAGSIDGFSQGQGKGVIPDKLTGQPHHWVVNSFRERFGKEFEGVYTRDQANNVESRVVDALNSGSAAGSIAIINLDPKGGPECHVMMIDRIKNGRVIFLDSRLEVSPGKESAALSILPPGAKLEGRSTWSMSTSELLDGEPPILDLVMLKGNGKAMTESEDRSIIRYHQTLESTVMPAGVEFTPHFNPSIDMQLEFKTPNQVQLATGKVGFATIKKQ